MLGFGVVDSKQQQALLLHLAGPGVQEIFKSIPVTTTGEAKDYDKAIDALTAHFSVKKNIPMARQAFLTTTPNPGERVHNFVTRLQTLALHCNYQEEKDNQIRDHVLTFIKDRHLKSKLYREENLTLEKLIEVITTYHDKEALVLVPETENLVNNVEKFKQKNQPSKFQGRCYRCDKIGHIARDCKAKFPLNKTSVRGRRRPEHVRSVVPEPQQLPEDDDDESGDYYVFCATRDQGSSSMELSIRDKIVNVIIDSGASCNLMSQTTFDLLSGGR